MRVARDCNVPTATEIPAPAIAAPSTSMRVLAAEDNPAFQSMLRTLLRKWGYEAVMAQNGYEALQVLESGDVPRLAVLDWMMPGIDGVRSAAGSERCARFR